MFKSNKELSGYTEFLSADCDDGYQDMRPRIEISDVNYSDWRITGATTARAWAEPEISMSMIITET